MPLSDSNRTRLMFAGGAAALLVALYLVKKRKAAEAAAVTAEAEVLAAGADLTTPGVADGDADAAPGAHGPGAPARQFKFYPEDFGPLAVAPLHLDLDFDVTEARVTVVSRTTFEVRGDRAVSSVQLNCSRDLEVVRVARVAAGEPLVIDAAAGIPDVKGNFVSHVASMAASPDALDYVQDSEKALLCVDLGESLAPGSQFVLLTETVAEPTEHILEGLYYDYTPAGQPRTIITQCQQYGFQRILPAVDKMVAKAFYTVRITADARYTNVITNGDPAPGFADEATGVPVFESVGPSRKRIVYHTHITSMAPYLFFLGCGTYVTYRRQLEFADGDTTMLELLVFPGFTKPEHARAALNDLHDSVQWVHLSTGPEACEHEAERAEIYRLIREREEIKAAVAPLVSSSEDAQSAGSPKKMSKSQKKKLAALRASLATLIGAWTKTGYKYTGSVYREIGMEKSDYGGMENVANTTILSSVLAPSDHIADDAVVYLTGVKAHEYYHNINGSQVTGMSPFTIWLNEACTVHFERQRVDEVYGADFMRLRQVLYAFRPATGPLAMDRAQTSMAVMPAGFNRTQELISAMTYSKAPEYVRMVQLLIGKDNFSRGLDAYHTEFAFGNATEADWVRAMEVAGGVDLQNMSATWLKRTGYPSVRVETAYDAARRVYTVSMTQTGWEQHEGGPVPGPWDFPVDWALVTNGAVTHEGVYRLQLASASFEVEGVESEPDFLSFARGWSFFGDYTVAGADDSALECQAHSDPDAVNRYFAYRAVADRHKAAIVEQLAAAGSSDYAIPAAFADLHARVLFDEALKPSTRALILLEAESLSSRPDLSHHYQEIADARTALLQAVWDAHGVRVLELFLRLEQADQPGPHHAGLHERALKRHCFQIIASQRQPGVLSTRRAAEEVASLRPDVDGMAERLLRNSCFMTDRIFGFAKVLCSSAANRDGIDREIREQWGQHPVSWEEYIRTISSLDADDAPARIRALMADPKFDINSPGHARTVARGWGAIRKRSLLTQDGLDLLVEIFVAIARVNQMSATALVAAFDDLDKFSGERRAKLVAALEQMQAGLDPVEHASMYGRIGQVLGSS